MSSNVRRRRRTVEERLGAAVRHLRPGDLAGRGEPLPRDRGASRVSGGPAGDGDRGVHIEHVTLQATASQTIASGGAGVEFDRIADPPTERVGFETLSARIATGGVVAIPIDITGPGHIIIAGLWASYRDGGDIVITHERNGVETTRTYTGGPITSRFFRGSDDGWEFRAGDTVSVTLPNSSGTGQTLTSASIMILVRNVASPTSPVVPDGIVTTYAGFQDGPSRPVTVSVTSDATVQPGDLLVAFVASGEPTVTSPSGWTRKAANFDSANESRYVIDFKYATAADASTTWQWSATDGAGSGLQLQVVVMVIRGYATEHDPFDATPGFDTDVATSLSLSTSPSHTGALLIAVGQGADQAEVAGMNLETVASGDANHVITVLSLNANAGAVSKTMSFDTSFLIGGYLLALRPASSVGTYNALQPQTIPTYDGSGEAMHPSVVVFDTAWNGYTHWLAFTPYPGSNDDYENPSIVASNDGETWEVPGALSNPIEPFPGGSTYNADSELVYNPDDDKLYCFWGYYDGTSKTIKVRSSSDGETWSAATSLFTTTAASANPLSPAVRKIGSTWWMWYVDQAASPNTMAYRTASAPDGTWSTASTCTITPPTGRDLWHLSVFVDDEGILRALIDDAALNVNGGTLTSLWLASSSDGITWTMADEPIIEVSDEAWDNERIYRATAVQDGATCRCWYSARDDDVVWGTGYTEFPMALFPDPA